MQISGNDTIKYNLRPWAPYGKVTKTQENKHSTQESQVFTSFPAGNYMTAMKRQGSIIKKMERDCTRNRWALK